MRMRPTVSPDWVVAHWRQQAILENRYEFRLSEGPLCATCATLEALAGAEFERSNHTIDESLRRALVGHRIEQPTKRRPGQVGAHPRVLVEDVVQTALLGNGLAGRRLDDFARFLRTDLARWSDHD